MTRYILLITLTILSSIFYSQNVGFLGKKTTIETTIGASPTPIGTLGSINESNFYIPTRHHIQLSRSMGRKFGMSLNFSHAYPSAGFDKTAYQKNSFWATGISFNFFTKASIAPIGKYFSFYLKYNSGKSEEFTYQQAGLIKEEELAVNFMTTGVSFNSMTFLSKKQPLYFKYSISCGIPFNTNMELNGRSLTESKSYDIKALRFKKYNTYYDIFELALGVGYVF
jgi:hypothetical protein